MAREEDDKLHSTIVITSGEESFKMRDIRPRMLNGKNWVVWKFRLEQVMRTNDILDILDGMFKKPIKITESDENGRTIVKNQKDIGHWNGFDGWTRSILSTPVEPALIEEHVSATSSHELWIKLKAIYEPSQWGKICTRDFHHPQKDVPTSSLERREYPSS